jgi:hypothetical protein
MSLTARTMLRMSKVAPRLPSIFNGEMPSDYQAVDIGFHCHRDPERLMPLLAVNLSLDCEAPSASDPTS